MPPVAFIRNLPALTAHRTIRPMEFQWATDRLENLRATIDEDGNPNPPPVHPLNLLIAMMIYRMEKSVTGKGRWEPVAQISAALERAFDQSFSAAPSTGQRIYLAVDVSRSMAKAPIQGVTGLTPRMAASAMAMAIARREPNHHIAFFARGGGRHDFRMESLELTAQDSLQEVMRKTDSLAFGGTDCALPMIDAAERGIPVDCFIILTDGETWAGRMHPAQALAEYRRRTSIPAKAVQLAFVSNSHSIMDPEDAGTLDIAGFDAAIPLLIHDFLTA